MKRSLLGLLVALLAFTGGVMTTKVFRPKQKPVPQPVFEKEIVSVPLYQPAPLNAPEKLEVPEKFELPADSEKEHLWAWYSLDDYPQMPEVSMIRFDINYATDDGTETDKPVLFAGVYTTLSKDIHEGFAKSVWVSFENDKLKFKTKKLKGIEYRFEGVFYKTQKTGEDGEKLLRGTLQKFVKGKKVAQVSGDFAFYEPYCLS